MYRRAVVCVVLCLLGQYVSAQAQHNEVNKQDFSIDASQLGDLKQCLECLSLAKAARTELAKSATQQAIMKVLEKACMLLPADTSTQCLGQLDDIGPMIIDYVVEKLEPTAVCRDLGICDPSGLAPVQPSTNNGTKETVECNLCEMFVRAVKDEIDAYQWYIKGFMDDFCARLPEIVQGKCQTLVDQRFPDVMNILDQILDPQVACIALKLCQ